MAVSPSFLTSTLPMLMIWNYIFITGMKINFQSIFYTKMHSGWHFSSIQKKFKVHISKMSPAISLGTGCSLVDLYVFSFECSKLLLWRNGSIRLLFYCSCTVMQIAAISTFIPKFYVWSTNSETADVKLLTPNFSHGKQMISPECHIVWKVTQWDSSRATSVSELQQGTGDTMPPWVSMSHSLNAAQHFIILWNLDKGQDGEGLLDCFPLL